MSWKCCCPWHALASLFWSSPLLSPGWLGSWGCPHSSVVMTAKVGTGTPPNLKFSTEGVCMLLLWHPQKGYEVGSSVFPTLQMIQWDPQRLSHFSKVKWEEPGPIVAPLPLDLSSSPFWSPPPGLLSPPVLSPHHFFQVLFSSGEKEYPRMSYLPPPHSHISTCLDLSAALSFPGGPYNDALPGKVTGSGFSREAVRKEALGLLHKCCGLAWSAMNKFP